MEKKCSKCATVFTCQSQTRGCWCEQIVLPKETLLYLETHFENCLCPGCLREFSKEKQDTVVNENQ